ncbi:MAG: hypothetical protein H8F28_16720 [Fibrella sp.]|nr:hypothetical protein [Armatimonadota bacterium]
MIGYNSKPLLSTGTNLAGAKFGQRETGKPPIHGQDYSHPHENEGNYSASKAMNVFRLSFHWKAMQHSPHL